MAAPQVPTGKRFLWGLGGFTDCLAYNGLNGLVDQVYCIAMGMSPTAIGLARSIPRFADLITDPVIGHLSDNTRSRWGRRRPWMLVGALLVALIAVLMWYPPLRFGPGVANAYVVTMMVILFTFGYSLFTIPYTAQGYELSTDYNERTHIFQWRQYAFAATGFVTPWLPLLCLKLDLVGGAPAAKGAVGIHWVSFGVAAMLLLTACGPIFGCPEGSGQRNDKKVRFADAIRFTLKNRAFWPLVASNFLVKFGMQITGIFFYYLMIYHMSGSNMEKGAAQWGIFCNAINIATVIAMAPVVKLTDKLGKKPALALLMLASVLTYASVWFTVRPQTAGWVLDFSSFFQHALHVPQIVAEGWPSLVTAAAIGICCNAMPLIMNSMLADVCDVDELYSGHRREAFYGATFVTCDKIAMAVAMFLQGVLLSASGFRSQLNAQAPETIAYWMKALLLTQPTGFLLGFACIMFYPITRDRALDVRRQLDERIANHGTPQS